MSADGWKAMKRLGNQVLVCNHCKAQFALDLPQTGGRVDVRHWRVEVRYRHDSVESLALHSWITCTQGCAQALAKKKDIERGRVLTRMRFSVHGPYVSNEP